MGSADGCESELTCEPDAQPASAAATPEPINKRRINTDTLPFAECDASKEGPGSCSGNCSGASAERIRLIGTNARNVRVSGQMRMLSVEYCNRVIASHRPAEPMKCARFTFAFGG